MLKFLLAVFVICILFFGLAGNSYAHKSQTIGDYEIKVGWKDEPPIIGESNAIEIIVSVSSESTNQDLLPGSGVTGLSDILEAYVSLNGKKTSLDIAEIEQSGVYVAEFFPTEFGHPMINLYGTVNGEEIEATLHPEKIKESSTPHLELTDKGTLGVTLSIEPQAMQKDSDSKIKIEFLNPKSGKIQEHIDYKIEIKNNEETVFGPIPLTHTSKGSVSIPYVFEQNGSHTIIVYVEGILFQPMPLETAQFSVKVGQMHDVMEKHPEITHKQIPTQKTSILPWIKNNAGWWAEGAINDFAFVQGIQFLIKEGIIQIPLTLTSQNNESNEIPLWIKNNAGWWAEGAIADSDFVSGIQYLISNGIVRV